MNARLGMWLLCCAAFAAAQAFAAEQQGHADTATRIVVPLHEIARGDVISDSDLGYQTVPQNRALPNAISSMSDLDGREARRSLRAGEPVRADDVRRPILVTKGSTVTMTFDAPGISLTAPGRAMSEGGMGESVVVLNPVSYRQVTATVTGAGQVRAGDATPVVLSQFASARDPSPQKDIQ